MCSMCLLSFQSCLLFHLVSIILSTAHLFSLITSLLPWLLSLSLSLLNYPLDLFIGHLYSSLVSCITIKVFLVFWFRMEFNHGSQEKSTWRKEETQCSEIKRGGEVNMISVYSWLFLTCCTLITSFLLTCFFFICLFLSSLGPIAVHNSLFPHLQNLFVAHLLLAQLFVSHLFVTHLSLLTCVLLVLLLTSLLLTCL